MSQSVINKNIIFVAFTKGHLMMLNELVKFFNKSDYNLFCFFSGYLYSYRELIDNNLNSTNYFFDDYPILKNKFKSFKLRGIINDINKITEKIEPNAIITFSDNNIIYQDMYKKWNTKSKVILFHEGYGDYSDISITKRQYIGFMLLKFIIWPHLFRVITRSYTGLYSHSFLTLPELVHRNFPMQKYVIPSIFFRDVFQKKCNVQIEPKSVLVVFSGKNWLKKKWNEYFFRLLNSINELNRQIYLKIAPSQNTNSYKQFIKPFNNISIIIDDEVTSESYCLHDNIDIIITDESSAVINSIFCEIKKEIYFLNKEIADLGIYHTDRNDLLNYLINKQIIFSSNIDNMVKLINQPNKKSFTFQVEESDIKKELKSLIDG